MIGLFSPAPIIRHRLCSDRCGASGQRFNRCGVFLAKPSSAPVLFVNPFTLNFTNEGKMLGVVWH